MTPQEIEALFTRTDGTFVCARWGRPVAPVVFGVEPETLAVVKGAVEAVCQVVGHEMAEMDPELGSNLLMFFCSDWAELLGVPDLDRLVPELADLVARLSAAEANQYRIFRFDEAGAIRAVFVFLRMDEAMSAVPADALALAQAVQSMALWSDRAFAEVPPLAAVDGKLMLRPEVARVLRAVYDPVLPAVSRDGSHALRLAARLEVGDA